MSFGCIFYVSSCTAYLSLFPISKQRINEKTVSRTGSTALSWPLQWPDLDARRSHYAVAALSQCQSSSGQQTISVCSSRQCLLLCARRNLLYTNPRDIPLASNSSYKLTHFFHRAELFIREPGERMVQEKPETRTSPTCPPFSPLLPTNPQPGVPNASTFHFVKEDHTLGNLLRAQLLRYPPVIFSGYKVPHPLIPEFELRVQTDGSTSPREMVLKACKDLVGDLDVLSRRFAQEMELQRVRKIGEA